MSPPPPAVHRALFIAYWTVAAAGIIHAVRAVVLNPSVQQSVAQGCWEWCGLEQGVHRFSAMVAGVVLVTWFFLVAWESRHRSSPGLHVTAALGLLGAGALLALNLFGLATLGAPVALTINAVCCAVVMVQAWILVDATRKEGGAHGT